jgi:hypothetical protein
MRVSARSLYEVSPQFQKYLLDLDYSSESIKDFCFSLCYSWVALSGPFEPITTYHFLGAFAKLRKATINFVTPVRPSAGKNSAPTGRIFMKFDTYVFFSKICGDISGLIKL